MSDCQSQVRSVMSQAANFPAANSRYMTAQKLAAAFRPFCKEWLNSSETASLTQETGPGFVSKLMREKPAAYEAICQAGIDADLTTRSSTFRYLTKPERLRLRRDTCPTQLRYMKTDAPVIDFTALIADHPDLYVFACGAVLQSQLAQSGVASKQFTKAQRRRIAERSCREALRHGLVNANGARGLLDVRVDEQAMYAIVLRFARQQASA